MNRFVKLIALAQPKQFMPDEGGGAAATIARSTEPETDLASPPDLGKTDDTPSPELAQADTSGTAAQTKDAPGSSDKDKPPEITADDLRSAARHEESVADTNTRMERDLAASSKEARSLKARETAQATALKEQGLEAKYNRQGEFVGFRTLENYSADVSADAPGVDDLSEVLQDQLVSDPAKVLTHVWNMAQRSFVRAHPTVAGETVEPQTATQLRDLVADLAGRKNLAGDPLFPTVKDDVDVVQSMLTEYSEAFQDAYHRSPREILPLLVNNIALQRMRLMQQAETKAKNDETNSQANRDAADLAPAGAGTARLHASSSDASRAAARTIAKSEDN